MLSYLHLIVCGLLIGLLSLYIGSISIMKSFDIPILDAFKDQIRQQEETKTPAQRLMQRQKILIEQRQKEFKHTMRSQKQKIRDNMRSLKEKMRNARYRNK